MTGIHNQRLLRAGITVKPCYNMTIEGPYNDIAKNSRVLLNWALVYWIITFELKNSGFNKSLRYIRNSR